MHVAVTANVNEVKLLHFLIRARSTLPYNPINVFCAHASLLACHAHKTETDTLRDRGFYLSNCGTLLCPLEKYATYLWTTFGTPRCCLV